LKPTVYDADVLASVGEGVTVTPVTEVPKVTVPFSVGGTRYCCWFVAAGTIVAGSVHSGVISTV
jgi:hypothetical protein